MRDRSDISMTGLGLVVMPNRRDARKTGRCQCNSEKEVGKIVQSLLLGCCRLLPLVHIPPSRWNSHRRVREHGKSCVLLLISPHPRVTYVSIDYTLTPSARLLNSAADCTLRLLRALEMLPGDLTLVMPSIVFSAFAVRALRAKPHSPRPSPASTSASDPRRSTDSRSHVY